MLKQYAVLGHDVKAGPRSFYVEAINWQQALYKANALIDFVDSLQEV